MPHRPPPIASIIGRSDRPAVRRTRGRRLVAAVLAWGLATVGAALPGVAAARPVPPPTPSDYTLAVSQTSNLVDGQVIGVHVTAGNGQKIAYTYTLSVNAYLCQFGPDYTAPNVNLAADCASGPVSTGSSYVAFYQPDLAGATATGAFVAGEGTANLGGPTRPPKTLTCGVGNPCALVVQVYNSAGISVVLPATELTYAPANTIPGCAAVAPDALHAEAPERFVSGSAAFATGACATKGGPGAGSAPVRTTFVNEAQAVNDFGAGQADLAYTAVGYGAPGFAPPTNRPYVAIPIALNAVVLASGGQQQVTVPKDRNGDTVFLPYTSLSLTTGEIASMYGRNGGDSSRFTQAQVAAIYARNPELPPGAPIFEGNPGVAQPPVALGGPDATTLFATTYFQKVGGAAWNDGSAVFPLHAPDPRGTQSDFSPPASALDSQKFPGLDLLSHRTDLQRVLFTDAAARGPDWVLTDLATASDLGQNLPVKVVALGSTAGDPPGPSGFVTPSAQTLGAAVPSLLPQPDGTSMPNSANVAAGAYPLTYVEYALAPAAPLANCNQQQLLTSYLSYLTGTGQTHLGPGLVALPTALQTQAQTAIAKLPGCAASAASGATSGATGGFGGAFGSGSGSGAAGLGGARPAALIGMGQTGPGLAAALAGIAKDGAAINALNKARAAAVGLPGFGGLRPLGWLLAAVALLSIGALISLMARVATGRPVALRPMLAGAASRAGVLARSRPLKRPRLRRRHPAGGDS